jgi:hypothetical protein
MKVANQDCHASTFLRMKAIELMHKELENIFHAPSAAFVPFAPWRFEGFSSSGPTWQHGISA